MAEHFSVDLTIVQGEVIVRALELCGAEDGLAAAVRSFNDPALAAAAKPARHRVHRALLKASQFLTQGIDAQRAVTTKRDEIEKLRSEKETLRYELHRITDDLAHVHRTLREVARLLVAGKADEATAVCRRSALVLEQFEEDVS